MARLQLCVVASLIGLCGSAFAAESKPAKAAAPTPAAEAKAAAAEAKAAAAEAKAAAAEVKAAAAELKAAIAGTKPATATAAATTPPAGDAPTPLADSAAIERIYQVMEAKGFNVPRENIRPSPLPGIYEVQRGHYFGYASADGKYVFQGDLLNLETGDSVTENARREDRLASLAKLGPDTFIEFPALQETGKKKKKVKKDVTKYWVSVFTDIDCGYCRKLHADLAQYNAQGIGLRYYFYPRTGLKTPSAEKAQVVWCAKDRADTFTKAKAGEAVEGSPACENPIAKDYQLAVDLGIRGTPALILPTGELVAGYLPAPALTAKLTGQPEEAVLAKQDPAPAAATKTPAEKEAAKQAAKEALAKDAAAAKDAKPAEAAVTPAAEAAKPAPAETPAATAPAKSDAAAPATPAS